MIGWPDRILWSSFQRIKLLCVKTNDADEIAPEEGAGKVEGLEGGSVACPRLNGAPTKG